MELSPQLYRLLVRQPWLTKKYIHNVVRHHFSFDGKMVVDFGAGVGSNCTLFCSEKYLGLDPDRKRIDFARRLYPNYRFDWFHGKDLPVTDESIDFIFITAVLHHVPFHALCGYLSEFRRVLKPSGRVVVIEPCYRPNAHLSNWFMARFDKGKYIQSEQGYLSLFTSHQYKVRVLNRFNKLMLYNELFFSAEPDN